MHTEENYGNSAHGARTFKLNRIVHIKLCIVHIRLRKLFINGNELHLQTENMQMVRMRCHAKLFWGEIKKKQYKF